MASTKVDWPAQIKRAPFVDVRSYGAKCNGTTDDSVALAAACAALPANGGVVMVPSGVMAIGSTFTVGNGVGTTQSTRNNITIQGQGSSAGNSSFPGATAIKWIGGASTMVRVQGPIHGVRFRDLVLDGGGTATILYDELASGSGGLENVAFRNVAAGGIIHRMDAVADNNGNCSGNTYTSVFNNAEASGASGLVLGATSLNANAGVFQNIFINYIINYANDAAGSVGVTLAWCDNNVFLNCSIKPILVPGSGIAVKHVRQSGVWDFLPSENTFIHTPIGDPAGAIGFSGNSGRGIGTICWPYQVFDSSGIPNIKNLRGWLGNGDFFDTSAKMAFQNILRVYARETLAQVSISGFTYYPLTGTVTSTGTALVGAGTIFNTELKVGKLVNSGNDFRYIAAIADDTHATLSAAFTDDLPAGSGLAYALGANALMYSDSAFNLVTQDVADIRLKTFATERLRIDGATGNIGATGILTATAADSVVSNAGGNTILAAQLINGQWRRAGGGAQTDTTPTAALIVAAIPNCSVGQVFDFTVYNNSGGAHTLALGSGVTADSGVTPTLTTTALNAHRFVFRVTNVTPASEAVVVLSAGQSAY